MKGVVVALLVATSGAWAQSPSPTGFGRLINPSGVPPGTAGAGFGRLIYPGTGGPPGTAPFRPSGRLYGAPGGRYGFAGGPRGVGHPRHNQAVIVPYPVFYGDYYYGYDVPPVQTDQGDQYDSSYGGAPPPPPPQQQSPVVIINQNFQPDRANPVMHDYSNTPLPPPSEPSQAAPPPDQSQAQPTLDSGSVIFLIALKDHTIFPAVAYWVENGTLNYITTQGVHNSASLDLVDRAFSKQLNSERNIDFALPEK
jgi:hypothetical protein